MARDYKISPLPSGEPAENVSAKWRPAAVLLAAFLLWRRNNCERSSSCDRFAECGPETEDRFAATMQTA
jgi:hypothetical protein